MPSIKIDDREIPFEDGDTIIRAAHRAGIDIPHYCWHPGLSVAANCRMCLVELVPGPGQRAMRLDILRWDAKKQQYTTEDKPKLQPACQVPCSDGMVVRSESSDHVAEARKAVQELLLLNHPVDCPICDQAGECRLQDYWLEHGRNKKRMRDTIVHKPKAVSFGPTIVYDAERCIVCTRCVRFTAEVAKDPVLDKRERGNLGEIFVSPGRELDNDYTLMTEHVCPVGALTAKDFRFKRRVWFLRSARSICQGCATGCNAFLDFDPRDQTVYRYRPRENEQVNKYWMCDPGMLSYTEAHEGRITTGKVGGKEVSGSDALAKAVAAFDGARPGSVAIVLSAEFNCEDNFALADFARDQLGSGEFFLAGKAPGKSDDILRHKDKNSNTLGATQAAGTSPPRSTDELFDAISKGKVTHVLGIGGNISSDVKAAAVLRKAKASVMISSHESALPSNAHVVLPAASWAEAKGTYVNAQGMPQRSERAIHPQGDSKPAWQWIAELAKGLGHEPRFRKIGAIRKAMRLTPTMAAAEAPPAAE